MSEPEFFDNMEDDNLPPREELALWIGEFMAASADAETLYRNHYCTMVANKIYEEFGAEGFCEMTMVMDNRAGWVSDIILESSDIDDILFKKHGIYDKRALSKARQTTAMNELNSKIWRLRRKYAKAISEELMITPEDDEDDDDE